MTSPRHGPSKETLMRINPYLSFDGQCQAAFEYYRQCLGGRIEGRGPLR